MSGLEGGGGRVTERGRGLKGGGGGLKKGSLYIEGGETQRGDKRGNFFIPIQL